MKSGLFFSFVSAILGGVIGAAAVLCCGGLQKVPDTFEKLKVKELVVSEKMLLWKDGKEDADLLIQDGGILARTKIIATQVCGNAILGNYVYTTPDDFIKKPLGQCSIYTEMASRADQGGILTVRSSKGGNTLDPNGVRNGLAYTVAFDGNETPLCVVRKNATSENTLMFDPRPFMQQLAGQQASTDAANAAAPKAGTVPANTMGNGAPVATPQPAHMQPTNAHAANQSQPQFSNFEAQPPLNAQVPTNIPR